MIRSAPGDVDRFTYGLLLGVYEARVAMISDDEAAPPLGGISAETAFEAQAVGDVVAVARLEGALKERQTEPGLSAPSPDLALVQSAAAEAQKAYEISRGDIMRRLSDEIAVSAVQFRPWAPF